jgi:YidC/Oxa1 family membrane protein insertase
MWIIPDISQEFRSMGWTAIIVALIYGGSQLLATEVSMATTPQTNEWQRKLFRVLPLFIVGGLFFYPNIPAGLVLYWMTTNLWTGGQQVVLKRRLGPLQIAAAPDGGGVAPAPVAVAVESKAAAGGATKAKPTKGGAKSKPKPSPAVAAEPAEGSTEGTAVHRPPTPRNRPSNQRRKPPKKR